MAYVLHEINGDYYMVIRIGAIWLKKQGYNRLKIRGGNRLKIQVSNVLPNNTAHSLITYYKQ
jgi:hypothetical protein